MPPGDLSGPGHKNFFSQIYKSRTFTDHRMQNRIRFPFKHSSIPYTRQYTLSQNAMITITKLTSSQRPGQIIEVNWSPESRVGLQEAHDDRHGRLVVSVVPGRIILFVCWLLFCYHVFYETRISCWWCTTWCPYKKTNSVFKVAIPHIL